MTSNLEHDPTLEGGLGHIREHYGNLIRCAASGAGRIRDERARPRGDAQPVAPDIHDDALRRRLEEDELMRQLGMI